MKLKNVFLSASVLIMAIAPNLVSARNQNSGMSANWSGYIAQSGTYTGVGASWIVPAVQPSLSLKTDSAWVGIGGVSSADLIQMGTEATSVEGAVTYQAWYEVLPKYAIPIPMQINAGDQIQANITLMKSNKWQLSLQDLSSGKDYSKLISYHSRMNSAEWIEEMPSSGTGLIPLDNFGKVKFENGWAINNGAKMSLKDAGALPVKMASSSGKIIASPSKLISKGRAFIVSRSQRIKALIFGRVRTKSSSADNGQF